MMQQLNRIKDAAAFSNIFELLVTEIKDAAPNNIKDAAACSNNGAAPNKILTCSWYDTPLG
jgi:hypothetical protein